MRIPGSLWRRVYGAIAKKPTNFSWVIDSMLSGSGMITTKEELDWVKKNGVKAVLTLTEEPLEKEWLNGIDYLHLPTLNHSAPDIEDIEKVVARLETRSDRTDYNLLDQLAIYYVCNRQAH